MLKGTVTYTSVNKCQNAYTGYFDGSRDHLLKKDDLKAKNKLKITVVPQGLYFFSSKLVS